MNRLESVLAVPQPRDCRAVVAYEGEPPEAERLQRLRESLGTGAVPMDLLDLSAPDAMAQWERLLHAADGQDILLTSDAAYQPWAWGLRLQQAALADPQVGAACALTDAHALFSPLPQVFDHAPWDPETLDTAVYLFGDHAVSEVPAVHRHACYLRAQALALREAWPVEAAGLDDWLVRWCAALRLRGQASVTFDSLFVAAPPVGMTALDPVEAQAYQVHGMWGHLSRKLAATEATVARQWPKAGLTGRPVALHVMHYWGGGLDKWVRDFVRADAARDHLLLTSYRIGSHGGQRIELYADAGSKQALRVWDIAEPIRSLASSHLEYRRVLREIQALFGIDLVMLSSMIGHTLDVLALGCPVAYVAHDFFPVCEAINPRFRDETCPNCDRDRLAACRQENPINTVFKDRALDDWLSLRAQFVQALVRCQARLFVPTRFVLRTLTQLEPQLGALQAFIIPHGLSDPPARIAWEPWPEGSRPRVLVLGVFNPNKGVALLEAIAEPLAAHADVLVMGCGPRGQALADKHGWRAIAKYSPQQLGDEVASWRPHLGLLLSVVPETFSFTLSELRAFGVPALATRLGAFAERIEDGVDGFLAEPHAGDMGARLSELMTVGKADLQAVAHGLADMAVRTTAEVVDDYAQVLDALTPPRSTRLAVRFSERSALTDSYLQLDQAVRTYTEGYVAVQKALESTQAALGQTQDALGQTHSAWTQASQSLESTTHRLDRLQTSLRGACAQLDQQLAAIDLRRHPWRLNAYLEQFNTFKRLVQEANDLAASTGQEHG